MHHANQSTSIRPILVFLPRPSGEFVVSRLIATGRAAACVSTMQELSEALETRVWALAITARPDIDAVLGLRALPVVNIEIFFHQTVDEDGRETSRKVFDGQAFLERVRLLTEQRPVRPPASADRAKPCRTTMPRQTNHGWIGRLRHLVSKRPAASSR
ncbi:hypothetical protein C8J35_11235 [Rhizobium sp. PP-F2F-G38]